MSDTSLPALSPRGSPWRALLGVVLRRALLLVPTLVLITLVTFSVAHFAPGDPLRLDADERVGRFGDDAIFRARLGMDRPLVARYGTWLRRLVQGDLGSSLVDRRPVTARLAEALPRTLAVSGGAVFLGWLVALPLGAWLARGEGRRLQRLVARGLVLTSGVPPLWLALLAVLSLASPHGLEWFPLQGLESDGAAAGGLGRLVDQLWHLVLPVSVLALPLVAASARHVQAALGEALRSDFVLAARGRGASERRVVWFHALPATGSTLLALAGLQLPHSVAGSVVVERVFGIGGMGVLAFEAVGARDYPVVMAASATVASVTLLAMGLVDVLGALVDPRLRFEGPR